MASAVPKIRINHEISNTLLKLGNKDTNKTHNILGRGGSLAWEEGGRWPTARAKINRIITGPRTHLGGIGVVALSIGRLTKYYRWPSSIKTTGHQDDRREWSGEKIRPDQITLFSQ